jgi:hypothetical protein
MEKLIVVYDRPIAGSISVKRVIEILDSEVLPHCHAVNLHFCDKKFPSDVITSGAFDVSIDCAISLWVDRIERLDQGKAALAAIDPQHTVYLVTESVPQEYASIDWADGQCSPGVTLFALLKRRTTVPAPEFYQSWLAHTQISLEIHPLTRYHRNAVLRKVYGAGDHWDGIVEERVDCLEDLEPARFYTSEEAKLRTVDDLLVFVDLAAGGMRVALLEEYILKRPSWL